MAYARIKSGTVTINSLGLGVPDASYYICDTKEDLKDLPTDGPLAAVGSVALVVGFDESKPTFEDSDKVYEGGGESASKAYMLSANKKWVYWSGVISLS